MNRRPTSPDNCPPGCSHETFHYCGEAGTHCDRHCVCACRMCRPGWTVDDVRALCRGLGWSQERFPDGYEDWRSPKGNRVLTFAGTTTSGFMLRTWFEGSRVVREEESAIAWLLST